MKKRLLSVALLASAWGGYSQVGIGTVSPNKSAQLDIISNDKGILIPRISLTSTTDTTTITSGNVNSLFVFNLTTQNDVTPGYYYWYNDRWMRIVNDADILALDKNTTNTSFTIVNDELVLTDSDGNIVSIPLSQINTVTTLVNNNDGTYTYTSEDGTVTVVDVPQSVVNQFENIVNSGPVTINGNTYITIEEYIENIVKANETVTTLVNNNDGTYTYTNEAGATVIIDVPASVVNQFESIYNNIVNEEITVGGTTYNTFEEYLTSVANEAVTIGGSTFIDVTGSGTAADPYEVSIKEGAANSMLITNAAGDVEWANLSTIVKANETVTTLVDNTDGTYTYTSEDGTVTNIKPVDYEYTVKETGRAWVSDESVYELVADITLATATNTFTLPSDVPVGATVIGVRFISKADGSISTNVLQYNSTNRELVLGTTGSFTVYHPAGSYYLIVEYAEN